MALNHYLVSLIILNILQQSPYILNDIITIAGIVIAVVVVIIIVAAVGVGVVVAATTIIVPT